MKSKTTKNTHGGKRAGAGMKPTGLAPKKALGIKVDPETKIHLVKLHETSGHSQAKIVEYAIKKLKKIPRVLE